MKTVVAKRQYGSIKWYEFQSFDEMMQDEVLSYLAQGDGYDGILDVYTDDKDMLSEKVVYEDWYTDADGNPKDKVYYIPNKSIMNKYYLQDGSIEAYPLSELPEDRKEHPVDNVLLSYVSRKPWNLE